MQVALGNLNLCFPEKDYNWKINVVKKCYINLTIDLFEFLYFPKINKKLLSEFIKFYNHNLVEEGKLKKKGTLFLSGHLSNWELTAFAYTKMFNDKLNIIAKIQASKNLNEKINEYRELSGNEIIEIGLPLKLIFEKLNKNEIVCFLIDQSAHPDYSIYINFFGKKVATFSGPAKIALKMRPELLVAFGVRNEDFSYDINFIKINYDDLIKYDSETISELTQRIQSVFESVIKKYPDQWLWFHKRFKHIKTEDV